MEKGISKTNNSIFQKEKTLSGKKALVIGGTSGIGFSVAQSLLADGAYVTVTGRKKPLDLPKNSLNFIKFESNSADIIKNENVLIKSALCECDILCICYGPFIQKPLHEMTNEDWLKISFDDYALPGVFTSYALKYMMKRKYGRIIFFGGTRTDSVRAYKTSAAYSGAKTGISVLVKSIALQYGKFGITCNAILPGFTHDAPKDTTEILPNDVANNVIFLLKSAELNGVLLNVDRGWNP
ncbi:MAG: SDR family oxidoreductase [Treponema sp.]